MWRLTAAVVSLSSRTQRWREPLRREARGADHVSGFFGGLGAPDLAETTTDPKRLFRALAKPAGSPFVFPHDIQSEVWDKWFTRRDEADLVIKMNTGSGKTVIGLIILKSSLNEGQGPAVYLVPDTQLESQVQETADGLGIAWTGDPRDAIPSRTGRFDRDRACRIQRAQQVRAAGSAGSLNRRRHDRGGRRTCLHSPSSKPVLAADRPRDALEGLDCTLQPILRST